MQHSIAARFAAWPARFVHPSARARERRLGLHPASAFVAAGGRQATLSRPDMGPLTALRAPWRSMIIPASVHSGSGRVRRTADMHWTSSARGGGHRRSSVAHAWPA
jgi:hypothetical protein